MRQSFNTFLDTLRTLQRPLSDWFVVIVGLAFTQLSLALSLIIVARRVSQVEYGQYLACYSLLSFLVVLPTFGLDLWILAKGESDTFDIIASWKGAFRLMSLLLLGWLGVVFILAIFLPVKTFRSDILIPIAIGLIFDSLTVLTFAAWRVKKMHLQVSIFQIISSLLLLVVTIFLHLQPGQIVLFSVVRAGLSILILFSVLIYTIPWLKLPVQKLPARQLFRSASPFVLADVATTVYLKADLTIVSLFLGSEGASIYGPALNLTNLLFMIPNALYFIVIPNLSRSFKSAKQSFLKWGKAQIIAQFISGILLSILVFVFAPMVIRITFGPSYQAAGVVFRLMSPILFIKSLNFGFGALLTASNCQTWRTTVQVISALFNLIANLVIISSIGIPGVILVYIFSELLLLLGYFFPNIKSLSEKTIHSLPWKNLSTPNGRTF